MTADFLILCGGARGSSRSQRWKAVQPKRIGIDQGRNRVHFRVDSLPKQLIVDLPAAVFDLMEIAAYVYTADQACGRGGEREFEYGTSWRRSFRFEIPVREPDLWNSQEVQSRLVQALSFLSDDEYEFVFSKSASPPSGKDYLFPPAKPDDGGVEEIMLFSGGLDSFAGAVQEIVGGGRKVALVSHVPTEKIGKPQRDLVKDIIRASGPGTPRPLHIQVTLNKDKVLGREFTQRTRSFVFAAFAGIVSHALGRSRFRVYENGIVSFNLPTSSQIVGGRASRTTHPRSLHYLSEFLTAVLGSRMEIENPFLWKTKTEILQSMKGNGHAHLCARTISCAHTMQRTNQYTHCGRCSQCVDRRFVALAAGFDAREDPPEMYESRWTTPLSDARDLTMFDRYVGSALQIHDMSGELAFMNAYGEVAKAISFGSQNARATMKQIFDLHKRHAGQVVAAMAGVIRTHSVEIASKSVPTDSALGLICDQNLASDETHSAKTKSKNEEPSRSVEFRVCEDTLSVWHKGQRCQLGNTREFYLIQHLARRSNLFVTVDALMDSVWDGQVVTKNAVQRTVSNLRRRLKESGLTDVEISSVRGGGCYTLTISATRQR